MPRSTVLLICLLACLVTAAKPSAAPAAEPRFITGHEWPFPDSADGNGTVVAVSAGVDPLGKRALFVELHSAADGRAAALLNGSVLLALPPGVELDGKPRLYYLESGKTSYAYSMKLLSGTSSELTGKPLAQLQQLGEESLALAPQASIALPTDPRITNKSLLLNWRLPSNVQSRALVNPLQPEQGLSRSVSLRASFPLKGSGALPLALYIGGLHCIERTQSSDGAVDIGGNIDGEWVSWETEVDPREVLVDGAGAAPRARSQTVGEPPSQLPQQSASEQSGGRQGAPATTKAIDPKASEVQVEEPAGQQSATTKPQAKEVTPGTLALAPETYRVPLKPITGAGSALAAPNVATASVGPSQLSPQAGSALAAPAAEMVLIPAGPFEMGSAVGPLDDRADEAPLHSVELPAYYIDRLPVTNRQFYNFVISSGYKPEGGWQKFYEPATADLPVRAVSWNDAAAYARWAGKRLPTEAEWEKAARGTDARTYPWGEEWSSEILPRTENYYALVGSPKLASPYGVLATCGILWQWTASAYAAYPFNAKAGGDKRVLRGGCYSNGRNIVRCANRYSEPPGVALNTFTFRCAKDAQ